MGKILESTWGERSDDAKDAKDEQPAFDRADATERYSAQFAVANRAVEAEQVAMRRPPEEAATAAQRHAR